jgi:hypothetical protein
MNVLDTTWIGDGTLKKQGSRQPTAPAYRGTLRINGRDYQVQLWWRRDGAGHRCLAFSPKTTKLGVLWPNLEKITTDSADFFGVLRVEDCQWRLRAWHERDSDDVAVRVKL